MLRGLEGRLRQANSEAVVLRGSAHGYVVQPPQDSVFDK